MRGGTRAVALVGAAVCAAVCVGGARAGTPGISLSQCGSSSDGFRFTINGAGLAAGTALEVDVTSSEPGAVPNPNYVFPAGATAPFISPVAILNPDGAFSFTFTSGTAQLLPATITGYAFDRVDEVTTGVLFTTTVSSSTVCTDGTTLATTAVGGGGSSAGRLPLTSLDQCKKVGWAAYGVFTNQGDCNSFVTTKEKNQPAQ